VQATSLARLGGGGGIVRHLTSKSQGMGVPKDEQQGRKSGGVLYVF
jgi:hypothetical protein